MYGKIKDAVVECKILESAINVFVNIIPSEVKKIIILQIIIYIIILKNKNDIDISIL
jgi:hypothetical protein